MFAGMLIGREAEVIMSANERLKGSSGLIVDETKNLLTIKTSYGKLLKIPKSVVTLNLLGMHGENRLTIEGSKLVGTPAERIKG